MYGHTNGYVVLEESDLRRMIVDKYGCTMDGRIDVRTYSMTDGRMIAGKYGRTTYGLTFVRTYGSMELLMQDSVTAVLTYYGCVGV